MRSNELRRKLDILEKELSPGSGANFERLATLLAEIEADMGITEEDSERELNAFLTRFGMGIGQEN